MQPFTNLSNYHDEVLFKDNEGNRFFAVTYSCFVPSKTKITLWTLYKGDKRLGLVETYGNCPLSIYQQAQQKGLI